MLLSCFLLAQLQLMKGLVKKEESSSFSAKERLKKWTILRKCWMGMYLSLPKLIKCYPIGDFIEICLHFALLYVCRVHVNSIPLHAVLAEVSSMLYPSFIEGSGLGGNPYCANDVAKYMLVYTIDMAMFVVVPEEFVIHIAIVLHLLLCVLVLVSSIRSKCRWTKYDFGNDIMSVTDLGFVDTRHMILCQYSDYLEIVALESNGKWMNISQCASTDDVWVRKYYPNEQFIVITQNLQTSQMCQEIGTIQSFSTMQLNYAQNNQKMLSQQQKNQFIREQQQQLQLQQQQQSQQQSYYYPHGDGNGSQLVVSILHVPSLQTLYSCNKCLEKERHFILNDSSPCLAVFESDRAKNNTRIRIFDLRLYQQKFKRFELTQAFCINEYFESEQIKLFIEIEAFDMTEMISIKSNHVIKIQDKTIWDIDTSKKKATELLENAPDIHSIEKINNRVLAFCGQWRVLFYDMPTKVKIRRIDLFHPGYLITLIQNQQDAYIALPSNSIKARKNAYLMKNQKKDEFVCLDQMALDRNDIHSARYCAESSSVSLVIGCQVYVNRNNLFYEEQKDSLDFSICVTE